MESHKERTHEGKSKPREHSGNRARLSDVRRYQGTAITYRCATTNKPVVIAGTHYGFRHWRQTAEVSQAISAAQTGSGRAGRIKGYTSIKVVQNMHYYILHKQSTIHLFDKRMFSTYIYRHNDYKQLQNTLRSVFRGLGRTFICMNSIHFMHLLYGVMHIC